MQTSLLLLLVFFFIGFVSHAQIDRGTNVLGGEFTFIPSKQKLAGQSPNDIMNLKIAPNISYFFRQNLALGLSLRF